MPPSPILSDLHWLLSSPALLSADRLPDGVLDGSAELGETWWRMLDQPDVETALAGAAQAQPFRVGRYAEALMRAALQRLRGYELLASGLAVQEAGISRGEFDFVLRGPDTLLHIELAVKVYVALPHMGRLLYVGPGLHDALDLKLDRLFHRQLRLAFTPAGRAALPPGELIQPLAWLRGWIFSHDTLTPIHDPLAPDHPRGWCRCWGEELPQLRTDSVWRSLSKPDWLAPRIAGVEALPFALWQRAAAQHFSESRHPLLLAEYAPAGEGGMELARGMVLSSDWPDPQWLDKLLHRVESSRSASHGC